MNSAHRMNSVSSFRGWKRPPELETLSQSQERNGSGDGLRFRSQLTGDSVEQFPELCEEIERRKRDHTSAATVIAMLAGRNEDD